MAEKKYRAKRFDHHYVRETLQGNLIPVPAVSIYIPAVKVLVQTKQEPGVGYHELYKKSRVYTGNYAEIVYRSLKHNLPSRGISPRSVTVLQHLVDWAVTLSRVQDPPQSLIDLLTPTHGSKK